MENVVSARRLRKSVLNSVGDVDLDLYNIDRRRQDRGRAHGIVNVKKENEVLVNFKTKIIIKLFLCSLILFSSIVSKMFFADVLKSNQEAVRIYNHYKADFSRSVILDKFEYRVQKFNTTSGNIIPDKIKNSIRDKYYSSIKPYILSFDLKESVKGIFKKTDGNSNELKKDEIKDGQNAIPNVQSADKTEMNGIGGAEPLEEKTEEVMSSISTMDMDIEQIKSKNINIIKPVSGTITSRYGTREEVFPDVDPYHTGIDIANKKGTEILSATKGVVTKVENNNKYYGNFVEVTENNVIFKYAHLDSIGVQLGNSINQKDRIGLMGSTGMSTGPHLHFEIRINNRTVNPEELVTF